MAFCPKCNAPMDAKAVACPACGYDFSDPTSSRRVPGAAAVVVGVLGGVALIAFDNNPVAQTVSGVLTLLSWIGIAVWAWRFARDAD